ncbi:MAG: hypothetical protein DDT33_01157 [Firmicutes bacterium]|nr:hypothetical protein [Bacillota bacterium]
MFELDTTSILFFQPCCPAKDMEDEDNGIAKSLLSL